MSTLPAESVPVQSHPDRPVPIAAIERELMQLWNRKDPGNEAITRACMSNLVILCSKVAQAHWMPEEIAEIVRFHPARVIVLVQDDDLPGTDLDASVGLMCHLTGGKRKRGSEYGTWK